MKQFLADNWLSLLIGMILILAFIIGGIQRHKERKLYGRKEDDKDPLGTVGAAMGATVFRELPPSITGVPPSGHFQQPDFGFDEQSEMEYEEKYGEK